MRVVALLFALLLPRSELARSSPLAEDDLGALLRSGQLHLDRNDAGRAIGAFESALRLRPDSAAAHYGLGVALRLWGDLEGAEKNLRAALALKPKYAEAHFVLGLVYGDRVGSEREGLPHFEAAVAENPSFADAHFNIGIIHWKSDEVEMAIEAFRKAASLRADSADFRLRLGQALAKAGRQTEALPELEAAVRLDPANRSAHYQLAIAYNAAGDSAGAERAMRTVRRLQLHGATSVGRDQSGLEYRKGLAALQSGDLERAIESLGRALESAFHEAQIRTTLGIAYLRKGDSEAAARELRQAVALDPKSPDAHLNLGVLFMRNGDAAAAEREFRSAAELDPGFGDAHFNLGLVMAAQRRWADAERQLRIAVALNPANARAHWNLGRVLKDSGRAAAALPYYESALQLDEGLSVAALEYAQLLEARGEAGRAIGVRERALDRDPLNQDLRNALVKSLEALGRASDAGRRRREFAVLSGAQYRRAIDRLTRGDYDAGIRMLQELVADHPEQAAVRRNLAFALFANRRFAEAAAQYEALVGRFPADGDLHLNLGAALREIPDLDGARRALETAARLSPNSAQAHYQLGLLYRAERDNARAMEQFHRARQLDPSLAPPRL
jgi:tetratricopeptide (TPR) repeat protein